jgi:hypothetical protein
MKWENRSSFEDFLYHAISGKSSSIPMVTGVTLAVLFVMWLGPQLGPQPIVKRAPEHVNVTAKATPSHLLPYEQCVNKHIGAITDERQLKDMLGYCAKANNVSIAKDIGVPSDH